MTERSREHGKPDATTVLLETYRAAVELHTAEATNLWSRASTVVTANAAIAAVVAYILDTRPRHNLLQADTIWTLLALAVCAAVLTWFFESTIRRSMQYHRYFLAKGREAEHDLRLLRESPIPDILSGAHEAARNRSVDVMGTRYFLTGASSFGMVQRGTFALAVAWSIAALYFFVRAVDC